MNERIRQIDGTIASIKRSISAVDEDLFTSLPVDLQGSETMVYAWVWVDMESMWNLAMKDIKFRSVKNYNLRLPLWLMLTLILRTRSKKGGSSINLTVRLVKTILSVQFVPDHIPSAEFITGIETACNAVWGLILKLPLGLDQTVYAF